MHGAFIVYKPEGLTSASCVSKIKYALIQNGYTDKKIRIGHGGTLDPFATGVLVILFGEATKLADTYLHSKKSYRGEITLGTQTTTADFTGEILDTQPVPSLSHEEWNKLAFTFVNEPYFQTPPMYSAKKIDGVALHDLARKGIEINRNAILKNIEHFELQLTPTLTFEVDCESGTYIRTLAEDLAKKAGTLAHLKSLCRTKSSDCKLDDAIALETLLKQLQEKAPLEKLPGYRPLSLIGSHISKIEITESDAAGIRHGKIKNIQNLCDLANLKYQKQHYVLATVQNSGVIALLSQTPPETFRVQSVFNPTQNYAT